MTWQNHDFDFGIQALQKLAKQVGCPWLISNALDVNTGLPLAGGSVVRVMERNGVRFGFMGLVEEAWLTTLAEVPRGDVRRAR